MDLTLLLDLVPDDVRRRLAAAATGAYGLREALTNYQSRMIGYAGAIVKASRETGQTRVGQR